MWCWPKAQETIDALCQQACMTRLGRLAALLLLVFGFAFAHPHVASPAHGGVGQELANGQNHGEYSSSGEVCGGDPAAYGLESAHHGPDSGTPGSADGCYQVDSMPPGSDDENPAIN
jgi:hypothetical protein